MRSYKVQFPNGEVAPYAVNLIAENMITQCDPDGNQFLLLKSITNHKQDQAAVPWEDRYVTVNGRRHHRIMIQFPPEMDENWVRYGLAKLGQISRTKLAEDAVLCVHNTASALNR